MSRGKRIAGLFVGCWLALVAVAAQQDGPYVLRGADGGLEAWSVEVAGQAASKRVDALRPGATLTIPSVGRYPSFEVKLRAPAADAPDVISVPAKSPIFVVADTHGEFEILAQMLASQKVVDARLRWAFGRGHLVVLGDVFDLGPDHLEILWLLYALEAQAARRAAACTCCSAITRRWRCAGTGAISTRSTWRRRGCWACRRTRRCFRRTACSGSGCGRGRWS
jgi:hypothetical protein